MLDLSDAFWKSDESDISAKVTMININYGKNKELMSACKALEEYSWLVEEIRRNRKEGIELDKAIEKATVSLDKDALLKPFLMGHLAEVKNMCLREYSEEEIKEMFKEDGIEQGIYSTRLSDIRKLMEKQGISSSEAMDIFDIPEADREKYNSLLDL